RRGAFLGPDGVSSKAQNLVAWKRRQNRALDPRKPQEEKNCGADELGGGIRTFEAHRAEIIPKFPWISHLVRICARDAGRERE
uniref:Uncharacterized protein n=1 Tax=Oryza brachyantha TaxID=4533 RepID=J3M1P1_ORYBR